MGRALGYRWSGTPTAVLFLGENDGVIHYPLRWDTLLLIDSAHREQTGGEVDIASPTLVLAAWG